MTSARESSEPTLPANTTYGTPDTRLSTGSHSDTMPGSMLPRTHARWIRRPLVATSLEVMPPLATTHRGRIRDTTSWTMVTRAVETACEMARLPSWLRPVTRALEVQMTTSEL